MKNKSKNKKSIQELILNFLSGKRAARSDEVTKHVEAIIQKQGEKRKVKPRYVIARALKKMVDDEVLNSYETEQSSFLSLSSQGRHKLRNIRLSAKNHLVSTTWDGYWRLIILDLPESQKSERDAVRYILKKAGFVQIKRSLWISPFPLEHMIINMKDDLNLHDGLMVIVSDKLDPDTELLLEKKFTQKEDA
jgi:DNA-binding transcriptional regulator PaaX